jgi:ATP synthase protein I
MEPPLSTRPIRYVLKWQALATVAIAAIAGIWVGVHGAVSAVLGGVVNLSACVVSAFVLGLGKPATAGATVVAVFRAEASKILVIVLQLWLVFATYRDVVLPAFLAAFVITVFLFGVALLVRD